MREGSRKLFLSICGALLTGKGREVKDDDGSVIGPRLTLFDLDDCGEPDFLHSLSRRRLCMQAKCPSLPRGKRKQPPTLLLRLLRSACFPAALDLARRLEPFGTASRTIRTETPVIRPLSCRVFSSAMISISLAHVRSDPYRRNFFLNLSSITLRSLSCCSCKLPPKQQFTLSVFLTELNTR